MNPLAIIEKHYSTNTDAYHRLVVHSRCVAHKALSIAKQHPEMKLDLPFVEEAAMMHDIGIYLCDAPAIDCHGKAHYLCHGYLGAGLLLQEGYPLHALVCERHTGTGISLEEILKGNLPLPHRDMRPVSLEEQLICFADKFYSKTKLDTEQSVDKIMKGLSRYGDEAQVRFAHWCKLFLG